METEEPKGVEEGAIVSKTPSTRLPAIQGLGELTWLETGIVGVEEALVRAELGQLEVGDLGRLRALFSDVVDGSAMKASCGLASSFGPKFM